ARTLEAGDPDLPGGPALSDCAPAPQPAVALHERGQRAAAAHVPRGADGPAARGRDLEPRRLARGAGLPARPRGRRPSARLLLLRPARPAPEPPPRLHADVPDLAEGRGRDRGRLRVALPPRRDRASRVRPAGRDRVLGRDQQAGLGALRPGPGGDRLEGLHPRAVLEPRGTAPRARQLRARARARAMKNAGRDLLT